MMLTGDWERPPYPGSATSCSQQGAAGQVFFLASPFGIVKTCWSTGYDNPNSYHKRQLNMVTLFLTGQAWSLSFYMWLLRSMDFTVYVNVSSLLRRSCCAERGNNPTVVWVSISGAAPASPSPPTDLHLLTPKLPICIICISLTQAPALPRTCHGKLNPFSNSSLCPFIGGAPGLVSVFTCFLIDFL